MAMNEAWTRRFSIQAEATLAGMEYGHLYQMVRSGRVPAPTHPYGRRMYYTSDEAKALAAKLKEQIEVFA